MGFRYGRQNANSANDAALTYHRDRLRAPESDPLLPLSFVFPTAAMPRLRSSRRTSSTGAIGQRLPFEVGAESSSKQPLTKTGVQRISRASPMWLTWLGRHSRLVYMVHRPVMVGLLRVLRGCAFGLGAVDLRFNPDRFSGKARARIRT